MSVSLLRMSVDRPIPQAKQPGSLLPGDLGMRLSRLEGVLFAGIKQLTLQHGLTPAEFGVLLLMADNPGLKQTDLGRAINADRSTMVAIMDRFEERGLAERRSSPHDRRSHALHLTARGEALLAELKPRIASHETKVLAILDPDEQRKLAELLDKIAANTVALR